MEQISSVFVAVSESELQHLRASTTDFDPKKCIWNQV